MVAEKMVDGEIQSRWTSIIYAAAKSLSVNFILVKKQHKQTNPEEFYECC